MRQEKWTETEVAAAVMAYWHELGFETYPEIDLGIRADIVAVRGPLYVWIETKTGLNSAVMAQGLRAQSHGAHRVYVAAPKPRRRSDGQWFLEIAAREMGIGILTVERPHSYQNSAPHRVTELVPSKWIRKPHGLERLKKACTPDTRCVEAGSASGGHMTDFRRTMNRIRVLVRKNPGMRTKDLLAEADHHYSSDSSARSSLHTYAARGDVLSNYGLYVMKDGGTLRWYAKEDVKDGPVRKDALRA